MSPRSIDMENNDLCPKCGKFHFTQEYLDKNKIDAQNEFDCPVCGTILYYSIVYRMLESGHKEHIMVFEEEKPVF